MVRFRHLSTIALFVSVLGLLGATFLPLILPPQAATAEPLEPAYAVGTQFDYGVVGDDADKTLEMGFRWMKIFIRWRDIQPTPGTPADGNWHQYDNKVNYLRSKGIKILALVFDPPDWALSTPNRYAPPKNDADLANFMAMLATRYKGRIAAYELWNEQNQAINWGNQRPSPERYANMLRAVYPPFKAADPNALLVTGGLAPAGDGDDHSAMGDLLYIKYLYRPSRPPDPAGPCSDPAAQADLEMGAKGYFDALGIHPYGGPWAPTAAPSDVQYEPPGVYFRRAEQARQMMEIWGCDDKPLFATEMGWLTAPQNNGVNCTLDSYFNPFLLDQQTRANYLVQAFEYARQNYPWMGPMFVMNLDFARGWNGGECTLAGWSLLKSDGSPTPAYTALKNMAKAPAEATTPQLSRETIVILVRPGTKSQTILSITNAALLSTSWSISSNRPWLTVEKQDSATILITVDAGLLSDGHHQATVTLTFDGRTITLPVTVSVTNQINTVYLPAIPKP